MPFRKIQLVDEEDFMTCTIATTVLDPEDIRNLKAIATLIVEKGYGWCIANRDPQKDDAWWQTVQQIHDNFNWDQLIAGDPITAIVHAGSLEFGSIRDFACGCPRIFPLPAVLLSNKIKYPPFD